MERARHLPAAVVPCLVGLVYASGRRRQRTDAVVRSVEDDMSIRELGGQLDGWMIEREGRRSTDRGKRVCAGGYLNEKRNG